MPSSQFTSKDVAIDLNIKLMLERKLRLRINQFNHKQVSVFTSTIRRTDEIPNFDPFEDELEKILYQHYVLVGTIFTDRINQMVLDEIEKSLVPVQEKSYQQVAMETLARKGKQRIPIVVDQHYRVKAAELSGKITKTTKNEARRALQAAKKMARSTSIVSVTKVDVAGQAGAFFRTTVNGRSTGIARLNTNEPAEAAKLTQVQILRGEQPSLRGGGASDGTKTWSNMADSRVRAGGSDSKFNHLSANQTVKLDQPFRVSGESMRYPGDTSLGASVGNIVSCRCAVSYDIKKVVKKMRERGVLESPPSEPLPRGARAATRKILADAEKPAIEFNQVANVVDDVDAKTLLELEHAWNGIPKDVQKIIAREGISINIGSTAKVTAKLKDPTGKFDRLMGFYDPEKKIISIGEWIFSNGKLKKIADPGRTLIHESGHAVDRILQKQGLGSKIRDFKKAFQAGIERISEMKVYTGQLDYYVGGVNTRAHNLSESFAESFASAYADKTKAGVSRKLFDKTMKETTAEVVKQIEKLK